MIWLKLALVSLVRIDFTEVSVDLFAFTYLDDTQIRVRGLQAEADKKGVDLIKCQEECSSVLQQLVSGQQKMKELTIENLDMKESLKTADEIQQELASEVKQKHNPKERGYVLPTHSSI